MARQPTTAAEENRCAAERRAAERLLGLYAREGAIYRRLRDLSRRQLQSLAATVSLAEIRRLLAAKKQCLDEIARLEDRERDLRETWRREHHRWEAAERSRVHAALREITGLIEDIIRCEELCDDELLRRTKGGVWTRP